MKIFTTTDEVRKYCSIGRDTQFEDIQSKLNRASRKFVVPEIGKALAASMETYYNGGSPDTTDDTSNGLLVRLQEAVANIGMLLYIPEGNVQVGSDGLNQNTNEDSGPAPWWAVKDLMRSYAQTGEEALDDVLDYMEANASSFTNWTSSDERAAFKDNLVQTTAEFNEHHNIFHSRRTFKALAPIMKEVEDLYLEQHLGSDTLDYFKTLSSPSAVEKKAQELLKSTVVNFTVLRACSTNLFTVSSEGMRSRSIMTVNSALERFTPAEESLIRKTEKEKERTANAYLGQLLKHLNSNASTTVFPVYFNSDYYEDPADQKEVTHTYNSKGFMSI